MYFDANLKLLSGKNTQKVNKQKNSGSVKLDVRWAELDIGFWNVEFEKSSLMNLIF